MVLQVLSGVQLLLKMSDSDRVRTVGRHRLRSVDEHVRDLSCVSRSQVLLVGPLVIGAIEIIRLTHD